MAVGAAASELICFTDNDSVTLGSTLGPSALGLLGTVALTNARWRDGTARSGQSRYGDGSLISPVHDDGRVYAFFDGHVEWRRQDEIKSQSRGLLMGGRSIFEPGISRYRAAGRPGTINWK